MRSAHRIPPRRQARRWHLGAQTRLVRRPRRGGIQTAHRIGRFAHHVHRVRARLGGVLCGEFASVLGEAGTGGGMLEGLLVHPDADIRSGAYW